MNSRQRRGVILLILSIVCALGAFAGVLSVIDDVKSKVGPEVTAYEVEAQVDRRRLAGRGEHVALVDVEDVGAHVDLRVAAGQVVGVHPVRGRGPAVEQACRGQQEGARAERGDPNAAPVGQA